MTEKNIVYGVAIEDLSSDSDESESNNMELDNTDTTVILLNEVIENDNYGKEEKKSAENTIKNKIHSMDLFVDILVRMQEQKNETLPDRINNTKQINKIIENNVNFIKHGKGRHCNLKKHTDEILRKNPSLKLSYKNI